MSIDKDKLREMAMAATQSHGARRVEADQNGVHVIGDGSWKILSAWHTPDGKGAKNAELAAAASPDTVLALLNEIGQASAEKELFRLAAEQLKAENEALRKGMKGDYDLDAWLAFVQEEPQIRKDAERYRAIRDEIPHSDLGRAILDVQTADEYDAAVDAAMAKEASQ
jgi:hypothetical protein